MHCHRKFEVSLFRALFQFIGDFAGAVGRFAKNLQWLPSDDPLVLDLNGDGLVSKGIGAVYWDNDGDLFGERSGWLSGYAERLGANDNRMNKFNGSVAA